MSNEDKAAIEGNNSDSQFSTRFEKGLSELINKHSMERETDTPDFILAEYLNACYRAYYWANVKKQSWASPSTVAVQGIKNKEEILAEYFNEINITTFKSLAGIYRAMQAYHDQFVQGITDIQCKCKPEDKHGETSIMCCNECGLPTEKFWTRESQTISTEGEEQKLFTLIEGKEIFEAGREAEYAEQFGAIPNQIKEKVKQKFGIDI